MNLKELVLKFNETHGPLTDAKTAHKRRERELQDALNEGDVQGFPVKIGSIVEIKPRARRRRGRNIETIPQSIKVSRLTLGFSWSERLFVIAHGQIIKANGTPGIRTGSKRYWLDEMIE